MRALKQSQFQPASLDGMPIESGANYAYSFELQGGRNGARRSFVAWYRKLLKAVQGGDRPAADTALAELEADNLYEGRYLQYGRFTYYRAWGTPQQQIRALTRAVGPDESTQFLPDDLMVDALRQLFAIQVELQDFGGALGTAERLHKIRNSSTGSPETICPVISRWWVTRGLSSESFRPRTSLERNVAPRQKQAVSLGKVAEGGVVGWCSISSLRDPLLRVYR